MLLGFCFCGFYGGCAGSGRLFFLEGRVRSCRLGFVFLKWICFFGFVFFFVFYRLFYEGRRVFFVVRVVLGYGRELCIVRV